MSKPTTPSSSILFLMVAVPVLLAGCQAMAEIAYDLAADEQRRRCELLASQPERSACLARVDKAEQQAGASRQGR